MQLAISLLRPRFVWVVVIALACWAVPGGSAYGQSSLHDAATALTKNLHADADVQKLTGERLVIAPFENINGQGDAVPRILQEMLTTSFIQQKHFKVVERDQLQKALDELHFQLSDLTDTTKAKQIGKLVGAAYILLGSVSDTGDSTDINARIVSIESGESIAADDAEIKTGGTPVAPGDANPVPPPTVVSPSTDPGPGPQPSLQTPKIDLNAHGLSESAGQWIGSKGNFGLLGTNDYKIAWRENLGADPVFSFAAGDLLGDGTSRLVLSKSSNIAVCKWSNNHFAETWHSDFIDRYDSDRLIALPSDKPQSVILDINDFANSTIFSVWQWNGTTYTKADLPNSNILVISDQEQEDVKNLVGVVYAGGNNQAGIFRLTAGMDDCPIHIAGEKNFSIGYTPQYIPGVTSGDYDGDGKSEVAVAYVSEVFVPKENAVRAKDTPIEIYDKAGNRKAVTADGYGSVVTSWRPKGVTKPFIVAERNVVDADNNPNGGHVYFIRWNGESYEEAWKSVKFEGSIIRMRVCDPKGEGTPGLVVLSADDKGYYLTKIVPAN